MNSRDNIPVILKIEDWPDEDLSAWRVLLEPTGLFEEEGGFSHWAEATKRAAKERYGQWLSFVARTRPKYLEIEPTKRITRDVVDDFIADSEERLSDVTIAGLLGNLVLFAKQHASKEDCAWLERRARVYWRKADAYGLKPPLPITARDVFKWSLKRLESIRNTSSLVTVSEAIDYRDALMVGCLISCPVRARTFIGMTEDEHVVETEGGYEFWFSAGDMKNKRPAEYLVHQDLVEPLRQYVATYRPALLRDRASNMLWIGRSGRPLTQGGFTAHFADVTECAFGLRLRPHAFRHIAATSIGEFDPKHVHMICDVLGHSSLDISEKHYNRASGVQACNRLQNLIKSVKSNLDRYEGQRRRC